MDRIKKAFETKAKIAYLTAGDADVNDLKALVRGGANLLELGIPFTDPVADGPTIQRAMQRALKKKTNLGDVFALVQSFRKDSDAAVILFSYFNPIQKDLAGFLKRAKESGADGILVVDLPMEEGCEFVRQCRLFDLAPIAVAAPSTPLERVRELSELYDGFLYYACRKGTTGAREKLPEDFKETIVRIKAHSRLPVAVGFGIATKETAADVLQVADGCVVGSHFVTAIEQGLNLEKRVQEIFL